MISDTDMDRVLAIFALGLCLLGVVAPLKSDANRVTAASQADARRDTDTSDDVNCTRIDDVTAARRSLCPAQCKCSPLEGQEVWTELTVDCSGYCCDCENNPLIFSTTWTDISDFTVSEIRVVICILLHLAHFTHVDVAQ